MKDLEVDGRTSAFIKLLSAMILMGTVGYFVIESQQKAQDVVFYRCLFGVIFMLIYCSSKGMLKNLNISKKYYLWIGLSGIFLVFNWVMLFESFKTASIAVSTTIYHIQPFLFVIIWSVIFREKVSIDKWVLMLFAFVGVVLVIDIDLASFNFSTEYSYGIFLALLAALFWAISAVITKKLQSLSTVAITPHIIVLIQLFIGVIILFPFTDIQIINEITNTQWVYLIILGLVHSCLTYVLMYSSYRDLSAPLIGIMTFIYPAVAIIVDYIFYDEILNTIQIIGVFIIMICSFLSTQNIKIFRNKDAITS